MEEIDVSKLSTTALQSIIALKGDSEIANEAKIELKMRKAREKQAQEAILEEGPVAPPVPNMPNELQREEASQNITDAIARIRLEQRQQGDK